MSVLLQPEAEADLDAIWLYVAKKSGSLETATRVVETISSRIWLLAEKPRLGRRRDDDLRAGLRSLPVGEWVILYRIEGEDVVILHVLRGSRDIAALLPD